MRVLWILALLLLAVPCAAQTATWTAPSNVTTPAQAQTLEYRLYLDTVPTVVTGVTCTGTAPVITCQVPVPAALAPSARRLGARWEVTAKDLANSSEESPKSAAFFPPPAAPSALRVLP